MNQPQFTSIHGNRHMGHVSIHIGGFAAAEPVSECCGANLIAADLDAFVCEKCDQYVTESGEVVAEQRRAI